MSSESHGDHPKWQAHHFDSPEQQFDAGKLGMWLFLATEILLFGGLFCAYSIYRANHPEIYHYAHTYLDVTLGAINTMVLIFSSLTMAWAVRASALGQKQLTSLMLVITIACGGGFMVIKYFEYMHKIHLGLLPGVHFLPLEAAPQAHGGDGTHDGDVDAEHAVHHEPGDPWEDPDPERPANVHIFFGIYFLMTGLHGVHVVGGMLVIGWLLWRNLRGDFSKEFNAPVELVGLYWHIVDLIWIYLFPLLYLIS